MRKGRGAGDSAPPAPDFDPVKLRYRHDGLTPARQVAVIQALAECGCVREACARVGVSAESLYRLARRPDAQSFRVAMDLALDGAVERIEDAAFSRALNGVEIPHYYKGELVGTHRRYDERLTMFILRYRKPHRYGKHIDRQPAMRHPETSALGLADALAWAEADAHRDAAGLRRTVGTALAEEDGRPWDKANLYRWGPAANAPPEPEPDDDDEFDDLDDPDDPDPVEGASLPEVPSTTSTSAPTRNRRARRAAVAKRRKR